MTIQGKTYSPRGDGIVVVGDNVYVLWSLADAEFKSYLPSELVKMTKELAVVKTALVGKNTGSPSVGNMAYHGDKLYMAALGGAQDDDDEEIQIRGCEDDQDLIQIRDQNLPVRNLRPGHHPNPFGRPREHVGNHFRAIRKRFEGHKISDRNDIGMLRPGFYLPAGFTGHKPTVRENVEKIRRKTQHAPLVRHIRPVSSR